MGRKFICRPRSECSNDDWEIPVKRTAVLFKKTAAMSWKKNRDNSMSASIMAVLFWIKQAMPETRKAPRDTTSE